VRSEEYKYKTHFFLQLTAHSWLWSLLVSPLRLTVSHVIIASRVTIRGVAISVLCLGINIDRRVAWLRQSPRSDRCGVQSSKLKQESPFMAFILNTEYGILFSFASRAAVRGVAIYEVLHIF